MKNEKNNVYKYVSIFLLMIFVLAILKFSSESNINSTYTSFSIPKYLLSFICGKNICNIYVDKIIFANLAIIRKMAHFTEYLCLGLLNIVVISYFKTIDKKILLNCFLFCILYAICDEIHQIYVPGRSCNLKDIIIDVIGSSIGIIIYYYFYSKKIIKIKLNKLYCR